jgi:hypothetical protein
MKILRAASLRAYIVTLDLPNTKQTKTFRKLYGHGRFSLKQNSVDFCELECRLQYKDGLSWRPPEHKTARLRPELTCLKTFYPASKVFRVAKSHTADGGEWAASRSG